MESTSHVYEHHVVAHLPMGEGGTATKIMQLCFRISKITTDSLTLLGIAILHSCSRTCIIQDIYPVLDQKSPNYDPLGGTYPYRYCQPHQPQPPRIMLFKAVLTEEERITILSLFRRAQAKHVRRTRVVYFGNYCRFNDC